MLKTKQETMFETLQKTFDKKCNDYFLEHEPTNPRDFIVNGDDYVVRRVQNDSSYEYIYVDNFGSIYFLSDDCNSTLIRLHKQGVITFYIEFSHEALEYANNVINKLNQVEKTYVKSK